MHFTSAPDGGSAFALLLLLTSNGINASSVLKSLELSLFLKSRVRWYVFVFKKRTVYIKGLSLSNMFFTKLHAAMEKTHSVHEVSC